MFQGMTARQGIPQQASDLGSGKSMCGNLDKFMRHPYDIGKKLLLQDIEENEDWPEMQHGKTGQRMRDMLHDIAKSQKQGRLAKKAQKGRNLRVWVSGQVHAEIVWYREGIAPAGPSTAYLMLRDVDAEDVSLHDLHICHSCFLDNGCPSRNRFCTLGRRGIPGDQHQ